MFLQQMTTYKILLADDDRDDRDLFKEILKEIDVDLNWLVETENGQQTVDYLEKQTAEGLPQVIILDHNMPFMTGEQVLAYIRPIEKYKSIPVVLYSTSILPTQKDKLISLGAEIVCEKPVKFEDYKKMVQKFLGLAKGEML